MGIQKSLCGKRLLPIVLLSMLCATGGCKQKRGQLWDSYSTRFIDSQGRVFDPMGDQHTTSEGQAYAMFFALAGNDRAHFDRVLNWTQANLAQGDLQSHLPAWLWGKDPNGIWKTLDANPASDADVWMAYTLLEAGRLWTSPAIHKSGPEDAGADCRQRGCESSWISVSCSFRVRQASSTIKTWTLNPSYLPLFHL